MENNPAPRGQLKLVRASGEETPFNAGDAIAAVVDRCGVVVGSIRARVGKHAKELLDDGVEPEVVVAACVMGVRAARPHLIPSFAQEILNARGGNVIDWGEYRDAIRRLNYDNRPKTAIDMAFENEKRRKR